MLELFQNDGSPSTRFHPLESYRVPKPQRETRTHLIFTSITCLPPSQDLSLKAIPSFSLTFSPSKHHRHPKFRTRLSIRMSSTQGVVEHIVLVKVKDDTEPSKVNAMLNALNSLANLDCVLHLTVGPLLHNGANTTTSDLRFTHMLHSRYNSKEDLQAYNANPNHIGTAREFLLPIIDDLMVVDWVAGDPSLPPPATGSALRISFLKVRERDEVKDEVLGAVRGMKDSVRGIGQFSCGENITPERAKGFSIASLAIFPGKRELEGVDWNEGLVNKVKEHVESMVVIDYVVP
ncbi:stress-response A/B barrel domain-containing protein UP3-like [Abrus precatorius]|uniref:Stress-response A/B barrel domain-containing protein UP3-like n=1 Tax=Abrus precatorius TaxID=3816 RepID=A0A8B8K3M4_ABRPR|nr:stress-response A/B barrel domain-containing protein UP3-like [Abrus precatorius]